jgi:serine protease Do
VTSSVGIVLAPADGGQGVVVQDVESDSPAFGKGFAVGDVITQVDGKSVPTVDAFEQAIEGVRDRGRDTALVKIQRGDAVRYIGLPLRN